MIILTLEKNNLTEKFVFGTIMMRPPKGLQKISSSKRSKLWFTAFSCNHGAEFNETNSLLSRFGNDVEKQCNLVFHLFFDRVALSSRSPCWSSPSSLLFFKRKNKLLFLLVLFSLEEKRTGTRHSVESTLMDGPAPGQPRACCALTPCCT